MTCEAEPCQKIAWQAGGKPGGRAACRQLKSMSRHVLMIIYMYII